MFYNLLISAFCLFFFGAEAYALQPVSVKQSFSSFNNINYNNLGSKSADTIVKDYRKELIIESRKKAYLKVKIEREILKKTTKEEGFLVLFYDKFRKIKQVDGWILDSEGKRIKKLNKVNTDDYSNISSFSLYEDSRVRTYQLYHDKLPYSVVYEYEMEFSSLLNLPNWIPQTNESEYVVQSSFTVSAPKDLKINFKEENFEGTYNYSESDKHYNHEWIVRDLDTFERERFSPPASWKLPKVSLSANEFEIDEYVGKLDSWKNFGKWYYQMSQGKDELPEKTKHEIDELTENIQSKREKARILYDYMQNKSRYISIQLGIGGWEPFPASFVEDTGYGDCKALTNYMYSILKYAGINSHPALINSSRYAMPIDNDFPQNQFNHVILHVPTDKDTLWLECTSQKLPFNYIGNNNSARKALLVTEEGGKLIDTPVYGADINKQTILTDIILDDKGNASFSVKGIYKGYYMERIVYDMAGLSEAKKKEELYKNIDINVFKIIDMDLSEVEQKKNPTTINYSLKTQSYTSSLGDRFFIPIKGLGYNSIKLPADSARKQPLLFRFEFTNNDSLNIHLPEGYYLEAKPEEIVIENDIIFYEISFSEYPELNKVSVKRKMILKKREVEASYYEILKQSFDAISRFDNQEIVINKIDN